MLHGTRIADVSTANPEQLAPEREPKGSALRRWAWVALLPPLLIGWLVWRFAPDVPLVDEWSLVYDLERHQEGSWTLADMFRSHNGHRMAVPRWLMIGLADASGWNTRLPTAVSWTLMLACAFWLARRLRPALASTPQTTRLIFLIGGSVALFSAAQFENWLWGIMVHAVLAATSVIAVAILFCASVRVREFGGALSAALVASFSHALGLMAWPLGSLLLLTAANPRTRRLGGTLWTVLGVAVISTQHLLHLPMDANAPSTPYLFEAPFSYAYFTLTFLGAPVTAFAGSAWPPNDPGIGFAAGLVALSAIATVAVHARSRLLRLAPWERLAATLTLFSIGCAALTGLARGAGGGPVALASRYGIWSTPLWIALGVLGARASYTAISAARRRIATVAGLCLVAALAWASATHLAKFRDRAVVLEKPIEALHRGEPDHYLAYLQPQIEQIQAARGYLKEHRLFHLPHATARPSRRESAPPEIRRMGKPAVAASDHSRPQPVPVDRLGQQQFVGGLADARLGSGADRRRTARVTLDPRQRRDREGGPTHRLSPGRSRRRPRVPAAVCRTAGAGGLSTRGRPGAGGRQLVRRPRRAALDRRCRRDTDIDSTLPPPAAESLAKPHWRRLWIVGTPTFIATSISAPLVVASPRGSRGPPPRPAGDLPSTGC